MTSKTETTIFQASDLNRQGRAVLDRARSEPTRLRDTDGLSIIMAPESDWEEKVSQAQALSRILHLTSLYIVFRSAREDESWSLNEESSRLGPWAWLRHLPSEDIPEFSSEVALALQDSVSAVDPEPLEQLIEEWRETAMVASDPLSREVFKAPFEPSDFVEVDRPEEG